MAVDMFLKIEGIDGESQDDKHGGEMDILAWSWGASSSGTMHVGGGGGAGKCSVQDIGVTKYVDKASKSLLEYCVSGKHFASGLLTVRKAGGTPVEYIKIELEELLITSVSTGGSGGEDRLTENVSLNFKKFKFIYTPQDAKGAAEAEIPFAWNIAGNTPY